MGAITKIRQISPVLLGVVAVLFIGFMLFGDLQCDSINRSGQSADKITAFSVNGENVSVAEYETRVRRTIDRQKAGDPKTEVDDEAVRQQVYDLMVTELLLEQEAKKLGIEITPDELREVMLVNPPKEIRDQFPDSAKGFNRALYEEVLLNPQKYLERLQNAKLSQDEINKSMARVLAFPRDLEDQIRFAKLQEVLSATVSASATSVSPTYVQWNYTMDNSTADVNFVAIDARRISDSAVSVSDDEIKTYYDAHKEGYEQKPSRRLKYIAFAAVPALKDTQNAVKNSSKIQAALNAQTTVEKRDSVFTIEMSRGNGVERDYTNASKVDPNTLMVLQSLQPTEVFGPLQTENGITYLRLDGRRTDNPSVRASHILISMTPIKDSAKAQANKILARIRKGEDFSLLAFQNSADPGSKQKGGDLDYVTKSTPFVEPFKSEILKSTNKVGDVLGPIETQFGYHIVKITDIQSEEIKFSELTVRPVYSQATKNLIRAQAQQTVKRIEEGADIEAIGKELKLPVLETALFQSTEPILNSYPLTTWSFENPKGTVTRKEVKTMGTVVAQITDTREKGVKPLEDVKDEVKSILLPRKKLDKLKPLADQIAAAIKSGGFAAINAMDTTLKMVVQQGVKNNGTLAGFGGEYYVTNKLFTNAVNGIDGPLRGERAWFITQVTNRTAADQSKFSAASNGIANGLAEKMRNETFGAWYQKIRENAEIVDERHKEQQ